MIVVVVSYQDLARVRLFDWLTEEDCRGIWSVWTIEGGRRMYLEQFLLGSGHFYIDHLDGDDLNFCRENLEEVNIEELVERRVRRATGISIEASNERPF